MHQTPVVGTLISYQAGEKRLAAFMTLPSSRKVLIFLGGLTDGPLCTDYAAAVSASATHAGWSVVQPLLSSSYLGYGISSLRTDCDEIDALLTSMLRPVGDGSEAPPVVVIMGHSTGCQIAVQFVRRGSRRGWVRGIILQAPVSDREYMATLPGTRGHLELAQRLVREDRGAELLPRAADEAPICAERFASLAGRGGEDDLFSSDLSGEELDECLGHVRRAGVLSLVVFSAADEYVPAHVDKASLLQRLTAALGAGTGGAMLSEGLLLDGADHAASGESPRAQVVDAVKRFLLQVRELDVAVDAGADAAADECHDEA
eukprot:g2615.t1